MGDHKVRIYLESTPHSNNDIVYLHIQTNMCQVTPVSNSHNIYQEFSHMYTCQQSLNSGLSKYYKTQPRLNIKTVLSTYGDFHVKDKTAVRTSYL